MGAFGIADIESTLVRLLRILELDSRIWGRNGEVDAFFQELFRRSLDVQVDGLPENCLLSAMFISAISKYDSE